MSTVANGREDDEATQCGGTEHVDRRGHPLEEPDEMPAPTPGQHPKRERERGKYERGKKKKKKRRREERGAASTSSARPTSESDDETASTEEVVDLSHMPAGLTSGEQKIWTLAEQKMAVMVGQDEIKKKLRAFLTVMMYKRRRGGEQRLRHIFITGPTGVGKTMLAEMIRELLCALGLVNDKFEVRNSGHLKGGNVQNVLERCEGGVLAIDEAYMLMRCRETNGLLTYHMNPAGFVCNAASPTMEEGGSGTSRSATINTLVIAAGYHEQMLQWLSPDNPTGNRGLGARISRLFAMESYTVEQLVGIAEVMMKTDPEHEGAALADDDARAALYTACSDVASVASARGVETLLQAVLEAHAQRGIVGGGKDYTKEDIEEGAFAWRQEIEAKKPGAAAFAKGPDSDVPGAAADARAVLRAWWFQRHKPAAKSYVVIGEAQKSFRAAHPGEARTLGMTSEARTTQFKQALQEALHEVPEEGVRGEYDDGEKVYLDAKPHGYNSIGKQTAASYRGWEARVEE
jgi:hypothetical protein